MYNPQIIAEYLDQGKTWTYISESKRANPDGKHRVNIKRWWDRRQKRKEREYAESNTSDSPTRQVSSPAKRTKKLSKNTRLPKYGNITPTEYRYSQVTLDIKNIDKLVKQFLDWRIQYAFRREEYNQQYIKDLIRLYFEVIINRVNKMPFLPRDAGKTMVAIDFIAYCMLEYRRSILVITSGGGSKRRFYQAVYRILRYREIRINYGDIIYSTSKLEGEIDLLPELKDANDIDPSLRIIGRLADLIGSHPKLMVFQEDIIQMPYKSSESESSLREWFDSVIIPMNTPISGTGTRKSPTDYYSYLQEVHHMEFMVRRAIEKEGVYPTDKDIIYTEKTGEYGEIISIPVSFTDEYKEQIKGFKFLPCPNYTAWKLLTRRMANLRAFESEMQQRPLSATGAYYDIDSWRIISDIPLSEVYGNCYIAIDPAFGMGKDADFFAMVVGLPINGKLKIVKIELKKNMSFDQQVQMIRFYQKKLNPLIIEIEAVFMQNWLAVEVNKYIPRLVANKRTTGVRNKIMRLDALDLPFRQGLIEICENAGDVSEAKKQFLMYDRKDSNASKKDDFLDATEMLYERTKHYLSSNELYIKSWNTRR